MQAVDLLPYWLFCRLSRAFPNKCFRVPCDVVCNSAVVSHLWAMLNPLIDLVRSVNLTDYQELCKCWSWLWSHSDAETFVIIDNDRVVAIVTLFFHLRVFSFVRPLAVLLDVPKLKYIRFTYMLWHWAQEWGFLKLPFQCSWWRWY